VSTSIVGPRTDANDGWTFAYDGDEATCICPACRKEWVEPDPIPLGGNGVPEVMACASCGATAENPRT